MSFNTDSECKLQISYFINIINMAWYLSFQKNAQLKILKRNCPNQNNLKIWIMFDNKIKNYQKNN